MIKKQKVGWIGLIGALIIVCILIILSYSDVINLTKGLGGDSSEAISSDELSEEAKQKVSEVQNTVGKEYEEMEN